MKETKHTPGPWKFNKQKVGWRAISDARGYSLMGDEEYYPWVPSDEADWHLIAAAPELLAACIGALAEIEAAGQAEGVIFGEDPAICEKLRAAIAKATGTT
jgi:hypothetical protein